MNTNGQIKGEYLVIYKSPRSQIERVRGAIQSKVFSFVGVCENFLPTGISAFRSENNEMLLVDYQDIIQLQPLDN